MKIAKWLIPLLTGVALLVSFSLVPSRATPKYAKETGKKCLDCHKKIPKKGEDPQLTELGAKFKENNHQLPK